MKKVVISLLAAVVVLLAACDEDEKTVAVTGVTLSGCNVTTLVVGADFDLTASVVPENASNQEVTWSSSNSNWATVVNGKVTAVAPGQVTITVATKDGNKMETCQFTVVAAPIPVESVSLDEATLTMYVTQEVTLVATVLPNTATNKAVTWSSSNAAVATVADGVVTAVSAGTANITVTTEDGGKTAVCAVTVTSSIPVSGVELDKTEHELVVGGTFTLEPIFTPANASNKDVTWSSDDADVATVSAGGVVTAIAIGTAIITVTTDDGDFEATCEVTVKPPPAEAITINRTVHTFPAGSEVNLTATTTPAGAAVVWSTSNPAVVTVSETGTVTAVGAGKAIVTATAMDANNAAITAECDVMVAFNPTAWTVKTHTLNAAGEEYNFLVDGSTGNPEHMFDWTTHNTFLSVNKPGQGSQAAYPEYLEELGLSLQPNPKLPGFTVDLKTQQSFNHILWGHRGNNAYSRLRVFAVNVFGSNNGVDFTKINGQGYENFVWVPSLAGYTSGTHEAQTDTSIQRIAIPQSSYQYIRIEIAMWSNIYNSHFTAFDPADEEAVTKFVGTGETAGGAQQIAVFGLSLIQ